MQKKTIYIAGRVKGLPFKTVEQIFFKRQMELEAEGFEVINPIEAMKVKNKLRVEHGKPPLSDDNPKDRQVIIKYCIALMMEADSIDLLFNWKESEFAQKERNIAHEIGMPINYPK